MAIDTALSDIRNGEIYPPPLHLRNPVNRVMKDMGYGKNYKYAHSFEGNIVKQSHLPEAIKDKKYYSPTENGYEKTISERIKHWKKNLW